MNIVEKMIYIRMVGRDFRIIYGAGDGLGHNGVEK
jgi:hypothetical protein